MTPLGLASSLIYSLNIKPRSCVVHDLDYMEHFSICKKASRHTSLIDPSYSRDSKSIGPMRTMGFDSWR